MLTSTVKAYVNSFVNVQPQASYFSTAAHPVDNSIWGLGEIVEIANPPTDTLKVQVVKNLKVEPSFKSLYIGTTETYVFTILEGSGYFSVHYDNQDLVDLIHKDREIIVKPLNGTGLIHITIEDVELPHAEPAHA